MLNPSELEARVLATLEEASQEDVPTLFNAVLLNEEAKQVHLSTFLNALRNLVLAGDVRLSTSRDAHRFLLDLSIEESMGELDKQSANLAFNPNEQWWYDVTVKGPPYGDLYPYVVLTRAGKQRSQELLAERGYQWWSPIV